MKTQIEQEIALLPEPAPPRVGVDAAAALSILHELRDVLYELDSEQLNNYLRLMIHKVGFDGKGRVEIEWLEPFNLWERQANRCTNE